MRDLIELKRLAGEATPGPWTAVDYGHEDGGAWWFVDTPCRKADIFQDGPTFEPNHYETDRGERDMKFIAAANPHTIIRLVARIERLQSDNEKLRVGVAALWGLAGGVALAAVTLALA
ncbi:MAG TPA: hypothetical protein VGD46_23750 [Rhizobacter sp.]